MEIMAQPGAPCSRRRRVEPGPRLHLRLTPSYRADDLDALVVDGHVPAGGTGVGVASGDDLAVLVTDDHDSFLDALAEASAGGFGRHLEHEGDARPGAPGTPGGEHGGVEASFGDRHAVESR